LLAVASDIAKSKMGKYRQHTDGRIYFSYAQVHQSVCDLADKVKKEFDPEVIVAIGGGGFIPARMMRSVLRIPILSVSLQLYDDSTNTVRDAVERIQWLDGSCINDKRILIVDEVDDTRTTMTYCVQELLKANPAAVAVAVVHNKLKEKHGQLPEDIAYYAAEELEDVWICYPWEAGDYGISIRDHEALARKCRDEEEDSAANQGLISSWGDQFCSSSHLIVMFLAGVTVSQLLFASRRK
jgi:hypoxanthine phosphoribosyltransferase